MSGNRPIIVMRWIARVWGAIVFLFWGAFFIEHLEWFADMGRLPPILVFGIQFIHLVMLAGLLLSWRWELLGGLLVLLSSLAFFGSVAGNNFPIFAFSTGVPALLWIVCGWHGLALGKVHCVG